MRKESLRQQRNSNGVSEMGPPRFKLVKLWKSRRWKERQRVLLCWGVKDNSKWTGTYIQNIHSDMISWFVPGNCGNSVRLYSERRYTARIHEIGISTEWVYYINLGPHRYGKYISRRREKKSKRVLPVYVPMKIIACKLEGNSFIHIG